MRANYETLTHYLETDSLWGIHGEPFRHLEKAGLLDPVTGEPHMDLIRPLLVSQDQPLQHDLEIALGHCHKMGAAYEFLGHIPTALSWYSLGQHLWRADQPFLPREKGEERTWRQSAADLQVRAAVCSSRVGEFERARKLCDWVVENLSFQNADLPPDGISHTPYWTSFTPRAYALCCLERWDEAAHVSQQMWDIAEGYSGLIRQTDWDLLLIPVVLAVSRYYVNPTAENRRHALEMLHPQAVATFANNEHQNVLPYMYALRAGLSDLAHPPDHEAPLPYVAIQASVECQSAFANDLPLDGTPESFKTLDLALNELNRLADKAGKQENLTLLLGSYIGETMRNQLPGGKWKPSPEGPVIRWELGDSLFEILPFAFLQAYLDGKSKVSLVKYWQQNESVYLQTVSAAVAD